MEIYNITFRQYIELEDKSLYNYALKYSRKLNEPLDLFEIGEFTKLKFGQVKDLQHNFSNGINWENLITFVTDLKKISPEKIAGHKFFDMCKFFRYISEQLSGLNDLEQNLYTRISSKDESAGIDNLSKFGVMIQIDRLAKGDLLKYDAIRDLPYSLCFTKMLMDKEINDFEIAKNKLNG